MFKGASNINNNIL